MAKTFTSWIKTHYKETDSSVGDLARDMIDDKELDCRTVRTFKQMEDYLYSQLACDGAHEALKKAHKKYENNIK